MSLQFVVLALGSSGQKKYRWVWKARFMGPYGSYPAEGNGVGPIPYVPSDRNDGQDIRIGEGEIFDVEEIGDEESAP